MKVSESGGIVYSDNAKGNNAHNKENGEFASKDGGKGAHEEYEGIVAAQGAYSDNPKNWWTLGIAADPSVTTVAELVSKGGKDAFSSFRDLTQCSKAFEAKMAAQACEALGCEEWVAITDGDDDKSGIDYAMIGPDGLVLMDLKSSMGGESDCYKLSLRKLFTHSGEDGAKVSEWLDGWLLDAKLRTTHYCFAETSRPGWLECLGKSLSAAKAAKAAAEEKGWKPTPDDIMGWEGMLDAEDEYLSGIESMSADIISRDDLMMIARAITGKDDGGLRKEADLLGNVLFREFDDIGRTDGVRAIKGFVDYLNEVGAEGKLEFSSVGRSRFKVSKDLTISGNWPVRLVLSADLSDGSRECYLSIPKANIRKTKYVKSLSWDGKEGA